MNSDIFIITSVINTGNKPWSYTNYRSYFNVQTRFEQTLQTIESIRNLNDGTKILLVECSQIDETMTNILKDKVDYFIQTYDDSSTREACLESNKKGFGEIKKLEKACQFIKDNNINFNRLFKISGRYFLISSFNKTNYNDNDKFTFKIYNTIIGGSTVLYSVPNKLFNVYIEKLEYTRKFYETNPPTGIETLIPLICTPNHDIDKLGVSGQVAILNGNGAIEVCIA
jgi:hypothetical protein